MDNNTKQTILITERKKIELNGVNNILGFTPDFIELSTTSGDLSIEGEELKIGELRQEDGRITVTGEIYGVFCVNKKIKRRFFRKNNQ